MADFWKFQILLKDEKPTLVISYPSISCEPPYTIVADPYTGFRFIVRRSEHSYEDITIDSPYTLEHELIESFSLPLPNNFYRIANDALNAHKLVRDGQFSPEQCIELAKKWQGYARE